MAIHASQGRRSGGSKKNSRRGYGNVTGAASSGAGSEQANAARTAKQGPRRGGKKSGNVKDAERLAKKHPVVSAVARGLLGPQDFSTINKNAGFESEVAKQGPRGGGTKTGFVKEMDDWRKKSPINGVAAGAMGPDKIAQLKAQSDANAAHKKSIDEAIASGNKGEQQPTGIGYTPRMVKYLSGKNVPEAVADMDDSIYQNLSDQRDKLEQARPTKPAPEALAKAETKEEPGGMMQVPPEKTKDIDKEMPSVPADAAQKGAEAAAKKKPKPRPTTWANGTPVGSGTNKDITHPDSLQARGGGGSTQKNPIAEEDKANTQLAKGTPAKKRPTFSSDTGGGRRSSNVTYDYSALDEARDKYAKAEATKGAAAQAAFEGDIGKTMAASHAIRSLLQQARAAEMIGPRIRQKQSSFTAPNREFSIG